MSILFFENSSSKSEEEEIELHKKAYEASKMLSAKEGLFVGISSGAALAAALKIKDRFQHIVIIMPDGGEKYLSVEGFVENDQC